MQPPDIDTVEEYIRDAAEYRGIDPDVAVAVARSEGLQPGTWQSNYSRNGIREPSFGAFQLLDGGPQTGFPVGMGNDFKAQTGLSPREMGNWKDMVDFALNQAADFGWGAWYGAAKVGVGKWDGLQGARSVPLGSVQTGPSQALLDFAQQGQQLDPFAVDTSLAGMFGMGAMPGIDGIHSSQMARDGVPEGKPFDGFSEFVGFNEARGPGRATAIGASFQDALGPNLSDFAVTDPFSAGPAAMSVASSPSRDAVIDGYTGYAESRGAGAPAQAVAGILADRFDNAFSAVNAPSVPQGRFDQAFNAFSAPSTNTTTVSSLPDLGASPTIGVHSAALGYAPPETLTGTPGTPATTTGQPGIAGPLDKGRVNGATVGAVIGGPIGALAGYALGPAIGRQGQSRGVFDKGRNTNSRGRGIGRGVSRAIGGVIAGPLGALAAPTIGRSLSNFGDFSLGGIATPEGWAGTPEGMGYASAMNGGSFWDGYTAATGGSNLNPESGRDFARAMAAEQLSNKEQGKPTWGDAVSRDWGGVGFGNDKDSDNENESDGGGCFLTTAAVDVTGEADNGDTLQTLRWFRDNIMRARPDWSADVDEYYRIAPAIVERLNGDRATYERLMTKHIRPAVKAIKAGEYEQAYRVYRAMVDELEKAKEKAR